MSNATVEFVSDDEDGYLVISDGIPNHHTHDVMHEIFRLVSGYDAGFCGRAGIAQNKDIETKGLILTVRKDVKSGIYAKVFSDETLDYFKVITYDREDAVISEEMSSINFDDVIMILNKSLDRFNH